MMAIRELEVVYQIEGALPAHWEAVRREWWLAIQKNLSLPPMVLNIQHIESETGDVVSVFRVRLRWQKTSGILNLKVLKAMESDLVRYLESAIEYVVGLDWPDEEREGLNG